MTEQTVNLNHNAAQCIKSYMNWGETVYVNICTHTSQSVQWGSVDYFLAMFMSALVGSFFLFLLLAIKEAGR